MQEKSNLLIYFFKYDLAGAISGSSVMGLRMFMAVLPMLGLIVAWIIFKKKYILDDRKIEEINEELKARV